MGEIPINMSHFLMVEEIFTRETPIVFMKQEKFFRKKKKEKARRSFANILFSEL